MSNHRNPRAKVPKPPPPANPVPDSLIRSIYGDLVEIEAIAVTAEECITMLPVVPTGKYKRTLAKLYTLVGKTADRAYDALERGEQLRDAHEAARTAMLRAKRQR